MIIDMHVHIFADTLAPRVLAQLEQMSGLTAVTDLTEADTRMRLREWGIDIGVMMPIATKPSQQRTINDWAAGLQGGSLLSFGTVHPAAADAGAELRRIRKLGLHGVKLHPDYQQFEADDRSVYPLYELAAELDLPLLFHAGFDPVSPSHSHCRPEQLARISRDLPDLTVIAAHLGGNCMYEESLRHLAGRDIYLDISLAPQFISHEQFSELIGRHDPERVLFASDCPWTNPAQEKEWVERLPAGKGIKERIFWRNAAELLRIQSAKSGM